MVQTNEIKAAIARKGMTQSDVAKAIGISNKTFCNRMRKRVFGSDEIDVMIDLLDIKDPMAFFFSRSVSLEDTDTSSASERR